jgi:GNAT superfamily N-acetyltransferase
MAGTKSVVAPRKCNIAIRQYTPGDDAAVKALFEHGMRQTITEGMRSGLDALVSCASSSSSQKTHSLPTDYLRNPRVYALMAVAAGGGFALGGWSAAGALSAGVAGWLYLLPLHVTRSYVAYSLSGDLRDISNHYIAVPGKTFVVAVNTDDGDRVVGCVAVDRPDVAGFAGGQFVASDTTDGELRRMSVAANVRGQGVGHRLLHAALDFARDAGYNNLILSTSHAQVFG